MNKNINTIPYGKVFLSNFAENKNKHNLNMQPDALAIANFFVKKANDTSNKLTLLPLVKLVYIAHGFLLALLDKSFLNPRFDRVEAWKYGPVIPSVYHSFKHNKSDAIKDVESNLRFNLDGTFELINPEVEDTDAIDVLEYVWASYGTRTATELVNLTHKKNSPWDRYYEEGKNVIIPDEATKFYYRKLVESLQ